MVLGARYSSSKIGTSESFVRLEYYLNVPTRSKAITLWPLDQVSRKKLGASQVKMLEPKLHGLDQTIVRELRAAQVYGQLSDTAFAKILELLIQRKVTVDGQRLKISDLRLHARLEVEMPTSGGLRLIRILEFEDGDRLDLESGRVLAGPQAYLLKGHIAFPIDAPEPWELASWGKEAISEYRQGLTPHSRDDLARGFKKVGVPDEDLEKLEVRRDPPDKFVLQLSAPIATARSVEVRAILQAIYGQEVAEIASNQPSSLYMSANDAADGMVQRDVEAEEDARRHLGFVGFRFERAAGNFVAKADNALRAVDPNGGVFPEEWEIIRDASVPSFHRDLQVQAKVKLLEDRGLIDLEVAIHSLQEDNKTVEALVDMKELIAWLNSDAAYVRLKDGSYVAPSAKFRDTLAVLDDLGAEPGRALISPLCVGLLQALGDAGALQTADDATQAWLDELSGMSHPKHIDAPESLKDTLREYQQFGLNWLMMLHRHKLTGILADDMGLGKTLQGLSLLLKVRELEGPKPCMVVAPTSVVTVWRDEAKKFAPDLSVALWYGPPKVRHAIDVDAADLVITSYGILRRDAEVLAEKKFRYVILDEAQSAKNAASQNAKAIRQLVSERRLALTGTPIENRPEELWSVFDFLAPGFLGSMRSFKARYGRPITRGEARPTMLLRTRIQPLVLRRLKRDVAKDLPEKIEQTLRCEMDTTQRALYDHIAGKLRKSVMEKIEQKGIERVQLDVLAALTRLRQICCDPALLPKGTAPDRVPDSAKLELFTEIMSEALDSDHRVVVFSQFVEMQKILIAALEEIGVEPLWLHGGTRHRDKVVAAFQDPDGPPVIVVSLRAGGMGLTLTRADTVVHYDPWWNPAVEAQATDRAHRIGQDQKVTVYKLICANSIEERVLDLATKKAEVAEALLGSEPGGGAKHITQEEVLDLLR